MARPSTTACTRATFTNDVACLKNFTLHQRKALMIYFNVVELAALGGTNYTAQLGPAGTLATAAACNDTLDPDQKELAHLLINYNNAQDAGSPATTPATWAEAIKCLQNQPEGMLDAMQLHVQCLLGRHAAYPQVNL